MIFTDNNLPPQVLDSLLLRFQQVTSIKTLRLVCKKWKNTLSNNIYTLSPFTISNNDIIKMPKMLPNLTHLDFSKLGLVNDVTVTPLTRSGISALEQVTSLVSVTLAGSSVRYADHLYNLSHVTHIRELNLMNFHRADVVKRFVEHVCNVTKLEGLKIQANFDGVELLRVLSNAHNLKYVGLHLSAPFSLPKSRQEAVIKYLSAIQGLKELSFRGNLQAVMGDLSTVFGRLEQLTLNLNYGVLLDGINETNLKMLNLVKNLRVEVCVDEGHLDLFKAARVIQHLRVDSMDDIPEWMVFQMIESQQNLKHIEFAHPFKLEDCWIERIFALSSMNSIITLKNIVLQKDQLKYIHYIPQGLQQLKIWLDYSDVNGMEALTSIDGLKQLHVGIRHRTSNEVSGFFKGIHGLRNIGNLGFDLDFEQLLPNIVRCMSVLTSLTLLDIKCGDIVEPDTIMQEVGCLMNLRRLCINVQHPKHSKMHNVISTVQPLTNLVHLKELVLKFLTPSNEHLQVLSAITELRHLDVIFAKRHGDWFPPRLEEVYRMYPSMRSLTAIAS